MKPYLNYITTFDASFDKTIPFTYLGAQLMIENELSVREYVSNSLPVYTNATTKHDKNNVIPANILQNGKTYAAKLRVKVDGEWTDWSPEQTFLCLKTPVVVFDSIDQQNFVYNNDILMTAVYHQEQGERVVNYQFVLMDRNKVPITNYPTRIPKDNSPTVFTERMSNLTRGVLYYAGIRIITKNGISHFETKEFIPQYIAPSINGILEASNQPESGQILVQAYLKQLLGSQVKAYIENAEDDEPWNYTYIDNEWIIIPQTKELLFTRLGMGKASDFVAKVWCKNVPNGVMLEFSCENGGEVKMTFEKHDNYITCKKKMFGLTSRTISNIVPGLLLNEFYLYIRVIEHRIEMVIIPKGVNFSVNLGMPQARDYFTIQTTGDHEVQEAVPFSLMALATNETIHEIEDHEYDLLSERNYIGVITSGADTQEKPQMACNFRLVDYLNEQLPWAIQGLSQKEQLDFLAERGRVIVSAYARGTTYEDDKTCEMKIRGKDGTFVGESSISPLTSYRKLQLICDFKEYKNWILEDGSVEFVLIGASEGDLYVDHIEVGLQIDLEKVGE